MCSQEGIFQTELVGQTMLLVPLKNLSELQIDRFDDETRSIFRQLEQQNIYRVVLDFEKTSFFDSTALGFFVKLWKRVRSQDGDMAFCCTSTYEQEILELTKLDSLWAICSTRQEALQHVAND